MKKLNVQVYQGDPSEVATKDNNNIFIQGDIEYNTGGGSKINSIGVIKDANGKTIIDITPKDTIVEVQFADYLTLEDESTLHYYRAEEYDFNCEFPTTTNILVRIPAGAKFYAKDERGEKIRYGYGVLLKNLDTSINLPAATINEIQTNAIELSCKVDIDAYISIDDVETVWYD